MSSKSIVLIVLACVSFLAGVIDQYFYPDNPFPPTAPAYTFISIFLVFLWYRLDSDKIGYRRSPWLNLSIVVLTIVALPYYFFRSRGVKRGFVAVGIMLLALIASGLLNVAGALSVYYGLQS